MIYEWNCVLDWYASYATLHLSEDVVLSVQNCVWLTLLVTTRNAGLLV